MLAITALYAGLLGLMSIVLASIPGRMRGANKVSIGDGGDPQLLLAIRRHGNFVEFVPLALILLGVLELNAAPALAIHGLGAALLVFRICHATALKADTLENIGRGIGAGGTALVTVVLSVWAIITFF